MLIRKILCLTADFFIKTDRDHSLTLTKVLKLRKPNDRQESGRVPSGVTVLHFVFAVALIQRYVYIM